MNGSASELEININSALTTELIHKTEQGVYENEIFLLIENLIVLNMTDTFMRLRSTSEYRQFTKQHKYLKESM